MDTGVTGVKKTPQSHQRIKNVSLSALTWRSTEKMKARYRQTNTEKRGTGKGETERKRAKEREKAAKKDFCKPNI